MNRPEQELQIAAVNYLRLALPDCQILHCANGGKRSKVEAKILKAMGVLAGAPDLLILWGDAWIGTWDPGCHRRPGAGWIELKAGKGKLSKAQEVFRDDCKRKGIFWVEARSLDDCERAVRSWGLQPRASVGGSAAGALRGLPGKPLAVVAGGVAVARPGGAGAGSDVRELPGAQAVPGGSAPALSAAERCKHGEPLRGLCERCNEETAVLLYDVFTDDVLDPKGDPDV